MWMKILKDVDIYELVYPLSHLDRRPSTRWHFHSLLRPCNWTRQCPVAVVKSNVSYKTDISRY